MLNVCLETLCNFIFPQFCECCGKSSIEFLCRECFKACKLFNTEDKCFRCQTPIDENDSICLSCKKGFFYPKKVIVLFEELIFDLNHLNKHKLKTLTALMTYAFYEQVSHPCFDSIQLAKKKQSSDQALLKGLAKSLSIPTEMTPFKKGGLLLFLPTYRSTQELNIIYLKFLELGYEDISFLCLAKSPLVI